MATLTIRNLDDDLKTSLRMKAAQNGHSMEEEARLILRYVLTEKPRQEGIGGRIHQLFASVGGVDLEPPPRTEKPRAPEL